MDHEGIEEAVEAVLPSLDVKKALVAAGLVITGAVVATLFHRSRGTRNIYESTTTTIVEKSADDQ